MTFAAPGRVYSLAALTENTSYSVQKNQLSSVVSVESSVEPDKVRKTLPSQSKDGGLLANRDKFGLKPTNTDDRRPRTET